MESTHTYVVADADTALSVGSGSLPVLGTPRLLAWVEAVTCQAIEAQLTPGQTSVGTRVSLEHLAPSPVGAEVTVSAQSSYVDGKLVRFTVAARSQGKLVGNGEVTRVIVDAERFMSRLS